MGKRAKVSIFLKLRYFFCLLCAACFKTERLLAKGSAKGASFRGKPTHVTSMDDAREVAQQSTGTLPNTEDHPPERPVP